jgi:hypothetical protein
MCMRLSFSTSEVDFTLIRTCVTSSIMVILSQVIANPLLHPTNSFCIFSDYIRSCCGLCATTTIATQRTTELLRLGRMELILPSLIVWTPLLDIIVAPSKTVQTPLWFRLRIPVIVRLYVKSLMLLLLFVDQGYEERLKLNLENKPRWRILRSRD